jgi:hypothetical protein
VSGPALLLAGLGIPLCAALLARAFSALLPPAGVAAALWLAGPALALAARALAAGRPPAAVVRGWPWLLAGAGLGSAAAAALATVAFGTARLDLGAAGTAASGPWTPSGAFAGTAPQLRALAAGEGRTAVVAGYAAGGDLSWARWTPAALPLLLRQEGAVLVVGAGGGADILVAKALGATSVRAVEPDRALVRAVEGPLAGFSGRPYSLPGVRAVVDAPRAFLQRDGQRYDVVRVNPFPAARGPAAAALVSAGDHLLTVEAFHQYLGHLRRGGLLAIAGIVPGPQTERVVATARRALDEGQARYPSAQLFVLRAAGSAMVIVKQEPFEEREVALLDTVSDALGWEVLYSPARSGGGAIGELLRAPSLEEFARGATHDLLPPTDERPFAGERARPGALLRFPPPAGGAPALDDRAISTVRVALAVLLAAAALVALPRAADTGRSVRLRSAPALAYFAALGLGCAAYGCGLLQRLIFLVGSPGPAFAAVAGLGLAAGAAGTLRALPLAGWRTTLRRRGAAVSLVLLVAAIVLPAVVEAALEAPPWVRTLVAAAVAAPAGYLIGPLLPLGLALAGERDRKLVPPALAAAIAFGAAGPALSLLVADAAGYTTALMIGPACLLVAAALADVV